MLVSWKRPEAKQEKETIKCRSAKILIKYVEPDDILNEIFKFLLKL
jgi:hypothetical protein